MAWIKLETHIFDKVEVYTLAESLQIDADSVVGKLCRIWSWFDVNTVDGVTPSVTKALLDRYCGNAGFCDAMISVKWMAENDGNIFLPNYDRHNSQTAKDRALGAKRAAKHKKNKDLEETKSNATTNAKPLAKSKIEKRREDNIYTADFESFWKAYPRHESKSQAMKSWKATKPDLQIVLKAIEIQKQGDQWKRNIIPHASTWLNQRRWEDQIPVTAATNDFYSKLAAREAQS